MIKSCMKNNLYENHFSFNMVIIIYNCKSNNQCIFYFLLIKKVLPAFTMFTINDLAYTERTNTLHFCVTSPYIKWHTAIVQIVTVKIQYGSVRCEKYLANSFCDTLASINLIYVSFAFWYHLLPGNL